MQRFGSAVKEHLAAYAGDRENAADGNSKLSKTLKSIAETPTSNEFKKQHIAQQAGFSAEVESVARRWTADIERPHRGYCRSGWIGQNDHRLRGSNEVRRQ